MTLSDPRAVGQAAQVPRYLSDVWLANRQTEASAERLRKHTAHLVAEWSAGLARFDEEVTRRQEVNAHTKPRLAWRGPALAAVQPQAVLQAQLAVSHSATAAGPRGLAVPASAGDSALPWALRAAAGPGGVAAPAEIARYHTSDAWSATVTEQPRRGKKPAATTVQLEHWQQMQTQPAPLPAPPAMGTQAPPGSRGGKRAVAAAEAAAAAAASAPVTSSTLVNATPSALTAVPASLRSPLAPPPMPTALDVVKLQAQQQLAFRARIQASSRIGSAPASLSAPASDGGADELSTLISHPSASAGAAAAAAPAAQPVSGFSLSAYRPLAASASLSHSLAQPALTAYDARACSVARPAGGSYALAPAVDASITAALAAAPPGAAGALSPAEERALDAARLVTQPDAATRSPTKRASLMQPAPAGSTAAFLRPPVAEAGARESPHFDPYTDELPVPSPMHGATGSAGPASVRAGHARSPAAAGTGKPRTAFTFSAVGGAHGEQSASAAALNAAAAAHQEAELAAPAVPEALRTAVLNQVAAPPAGVRTLPGSFAGLSLAPVSASGAESQQQQQQQPQLVPAGRAAPLLGVKTIVLESVPPPPTAAEVAEAAKKAAAARSRFPGSGGGSAASRRGQPAPAPPAMQNTYVAGGVNNALVLPPPVAYQLPAGAVQPAGVQRIVPAPAAAAAAATAAPAAAASSASAPAAPAGSIAVPRAATVNEFATQAPQPTAHLYSIAHEPLPKMTVGAGKLRAQVPVMTSGSALSTQPDAARANLARAAAHVVRKHDLLEVEVIKTTLAQNNVSVPTSTLERALVAPMVTVPDQARNVFLPPMTTLVANPYAPVAAKKTKRKTAAKKQ